MKRCLTKGPLSRIRSGCNENNDNPETNYENGGRKIMKIVSPLSCLALAGSLALSMPSGDLESVLKQMDEAAAKFRTTQANFTWTQYNKVIDEASETQQGKIYFRHAGKETQMAAEISQ